MTVADAACDSVAVAVDGAADWVSVGCTVAAGDVEAGLGRDFFTTETLTKLNFLFFTCVFDAVSVSIAVVAVVVVGDLLLGCDVLAAGVGLAAAVDGLAWPPDLPAVFARASSSIALTPP